METSGPFAIQSTEIHKARKNKSTSFEMVSAKGGTHLEPGGCAPGFVESETASAESAIHFRRQFHASWRDAQPPPELSFTSYLARRIASPDFDSDCPACMLIRPYTGRAESRFQRLFTCNRIPGAMPQARMMQRL